MNPPQIPVLAIAAPPVLVIISREQVDLQDYEELLLALRPMADDAESTREYGGRLEFVFEGFENDPREVYAIPEIRQFVSSLTERFPFWFHFCGKVDDTLFALMACLMPLGETVIQDGLAITPRLPGSEGVIHRLFVGMNTLYADHGFTKAEQSMTTKIVSEYLRGYFVAE